MMKNFISLATGFLILIISLFLMHNIYVSAKHKSLKQLHSQQDLLLVHASNQLTSHLDNEMKMFKLAFTNNCESEESCINFINMAYKNHSDHLLSISFSNDNMTYTTGLDVNSTELEKMESEHTVHTYHMDIKNRKIFGSARILLDMHQIAEDTLGKACLFDLGCAWLIAPGGKVLYHSNRGATGLNINEFLKELEGGQAVIDDINNGVIGNQRYIGFDSPAKIKRIPKHINFRPIIIDGQAWTVAVLTPESKLIGNISELRQDMIILLIFLTIVTFAYVFYNYKTKIHLNRLEIMIDADYKVLQEKQEKNFLFDAVPVHVWQLDESMNILNLNQAAADFFQLQKIDLIGTHYYQLFGKKSPFCTELNNTIVSGKSSAQSFVFQSDYGHKISLWLKAELLAYEDETRNKRTTLLIINDISDLKQTQLQLAREKGQLHTILEHLTDGVITLDMSQHITMCNNAAISIIGADEYNVIGEQIDRVLQSVNPTTGMIISNPMELILSQSDIDRETRLLFQKPDKPDKHVEAVATYIKDLNGNRTGIVLNIKDVTLRYAFDREIQKVEQMKTISLMAGGIAHDFNNFLSSILSNINLAETMIPADHKSSDIFSTIKEASKNAAGLAKQLQYFSQNEKPARKVTDLMPLLTNSVSFAVTGSTVSLDMVLHNSLWNVNIDAAQISQIFSNITLNAVQAMDGYGILTVKTENVSISPFQIPGLNPGNYIRVSFSDTGCGISETDQANIFTPYFTTKEAGSGLGLAVSYSIIQMHEGTITVDSLPDKGSQFTIYLPATNDQLIEKEQKTSVHSCIGDYDILILEDDKYFSISIKQFLENYGHTVTMTGTSEEAFIAFKEKANSGGMFDIIILDFVVPGNHNGCTLLQMMHQIDSTVPAILTTGMSSDPVIDRYKEYGFSKLLHKPFDMNDLCQAIKSAIEK